MSNIIHSEQLAGVNTIHCIYSKTSHDNERMNNYEYENNTINSSVLITVQRSRGWGHDQLPPQTGR